MSDILNIYYNSEDIVRKVLRRPVLNHESSSGVAVIASINAIEGLGTSSLCDRLIKEIQKRGYITSKHPEKNPYFEDTFNFGVTTEEGVDSLVISVGYLYSQPDRKAIKMAFIVRYSEPILKEKNVYLD